uniref:AAA+ ATPase domain-containing protein n=1 Tax=Oryza punctata TaxID=4537 RepID=A0A0E0M8N0_ORYPU
MAVVLGAFVPDTAAQWRSVVKGEVARQLGVEAEARKLEARLEKVGAAVRDAEARVARGNDAAARWLARVRAVAYEADVAVDRCRAMARRLMRGREQQLQQHNQQEHLGGNGVAEQLILLRVVLRRLGEKALPWLLSTCCDVAEPRRDIAADLKNVSQKLKAILKEQRQLQLQASVADHTDHPRKILRHRKSEPTDIDIVGTAMEDDARRLVRRLTQPDSGGVVVIYGPNGIGKTTLAKVVFDSERVKRRFETRSWVRVSRGCVEDGKREAALLSQVVEAVDGGATTGAETVAELEKMLAGLVANKRFLLVLDEVRNGGEWEELVRRLLERGGRGSKVLVTAITAGIARDMGAGHVHRVNRLGEDDGWALLRLAACVAEDGAALKGVGRRIIGKCGGVPLAIKAVAGVLRTREAIAEEWAVVDASPAWKVKGLPDDAMKPLYLCYDDMPCHLKQCFLYCSLFLSDFAVDRRSLVQQWIAEGFVQIRGDASVEQVAEEYYDELIGRNLLQPAEADRHGCVERCTMHDMLRSMAQVLSHGENLTGDAQRLPNDGDASFAPRHVSFPRNHLAAIPEQVLKLEGVRTLLLQRNPLTIGSNIFTRLLYLKVLDLTETAMEVIPETLGNLLYLRFLNLSQTRIKALPDTICNLWSLKFLLLRECKALHVLPKGIEHLKGLRDLDLTGTVIKDAAFRVGHLRNLTSFRCFTVTSKEARTVHDTARTVQDTVQDRSGWPLDELKNLCQLRTLHVKRLEKAISQTQAAEVALHAKTGLRELELSCSGTVKTLQIPTVVQNIEDIFRELKPPRGLESLKIANYFGTKFPTWLSSTCLPNLLRLNITGCNFCQSFPLLGHLPELRSLCIADSSALKDIDTQFMDTDHSHQVPFPKLEDLHLQGLHNLETWTSIEAGALPSLQALQLESCPKLRCLPDGLRHVTSMTELRIVDMESLEAVENIAALRELSVWNTPNLKKIYNLPSLEDLDICHCPLLETVENINRLKEVHIFDHELQEMPKWIQAHASKLCSLEFMSTTELLKRCLVDGPDWPVIKDIGQVHGYSNDSSYIYYSKSLKIFEGSASIRESRDAEGSVADSDKVDDVSIESRKVDREEGLVSSSGTNTVEIDGFFNSKLVEIGTARSEDNVPDRNMESFMTRSTCRQLPKLEEVPEEDEDEEEEGPDPVVLVPDDTTKSDTVPEKLHPVVTHDHNDKAGSKMKRDAPANKLVREGSRAISITETDQDLNLNLFQSKGHASSKGKVDASGSVIAKVKEGRHQSAKTNDRKHTGAHDTATKMSALSVEKSTPETVKLVPIKVTKSNPKATDYHGTENKSPDSLVCSRQTISQIKEDVSDAETLKAANHPSNVITENHPDKANKNAASATAITTVHATDTAQDLHSSLLHDEPHLPDVVSSTSTSISENCNQTESSNTSLSANLNHEESKATGFTKTTCDSGPCKLTATLACKQITDPSDDTVASIKKMATKISEKVCNTWSAEPLKHPAETVKITRSSSLPIDSKSHVIDITAATKKLEATLTNRFSRNAAAGLTDDRTPVYNEAPKVYTAIWADTDTDTLKARFLSTMQHYRRMASRRRRRHRKQGSRTKWSIWPLLVAVLLIVSVAQLLFTFWIYCLVRSIPKNFGGRKWILKQFGANQFQVALCSCDLLPLKPSSEIWEGERKLGEMKGISMRKKHSKNYLNKIRLTGGQTTLQSFLFKSRVVDEELKPISPPPPLPRKEEEEEPISPPQPPKREIIRVTTKAIVKEKASAFSSVGSSSSSWKSGGGGVLNAAALFRRFNSSAPAPRADAAPASAGVAEAAGDGDGGVRLEIEEIAAGDRRRETRKRKSPLDASGGGWWHGEMEGVDGEEVGWTDDMWEGMGSITLGGLEWH